LIHCCILLDFLCELDDYLLDAQIFQNYRTGVYKSQIAITTKFYTLAPTSKRVFSLELPSCHPSGILDILKTYAPQI